MRPCAYLLRLLEAVRGVAADAVFSSLLKVRDFLERQVETRGGTARIGYMPISGNNPNGRRGKEGESER